MYTVDSPQPPPIEPLLTILLNEIAAIPADPSTPLRTGFVLVLDDYHTIDSKPVDPRPSPFWSEHQPPQMRLVIATREDTQFPLALARPRANDRALRGQTALHTRWKPPSFSIG
ncbi:MAG: hypothetical protein IPO15_15415 [Anaerolineae bacterium]|uniref:helix-turn-helix transcriptional regulator n=1 Tax=Candidatus Amarolinea dominans TaxID=3140696 RepID=UPI00313692B1|nr:hypothetical protein [Anaerolineae bacterium]